MVVGACAVVIGPVWTVVMVGVALGRGLPPRSTGFGYSPSLTRCFCILVYVIGCLAAAWMCRYVVWQDERRWCDELVELLVQMTGLCLCGILAMGRR